MGILERILKGWPSTLLGLVAGVYAIIGPQIPADCKVFASNWRVWLPAAIFIAWGGSIKGFKSKG